MNIYERIIGLSVSSLLFIALLGYVFQHPAIAQPEEVKCPCRYDLIPMTTECWSDQIISQPPIWESPQTDPVSEEGCSLTAEDDASGDRISLFVTTEARDTLACEINNESDSGFRDACTPPVGPPTIAVTDLTSEELKACQCELLAYVKALNESGISVSGGPPYTCGNVDCSPPPPPAPIPTLNQWGLIALAVVLGIVGIVGFMVIRRRKVTA